MVVLLEPQSRAASLRRAIAVGATVAGAWIAIAVGLAVAGSAAAGQVSAQVPVRFTGAAPAYMDVVLPCVQGWSLDGGGCEPAAPAAQWLGGAALPLSHSGGLVAAPNNVSSMASILAFAPTWVALIGAGIVVLLLVPVVRTTASGRLFEQTNARRLAIAAVTVLAAGVLATAGPALAASSIIGLLEQTRIYSGDGSFPMPHGWLTYDLRITWWPLLISVLLGILATATRSGARLVRDTEGLV